MYLLLFTSALVAYFIMVLITTIIARKDFFIQCGPCIRKGCLPLRQTFTITKKTLSLVGQKKYCAQ